MPSWHKLGVNAAGNAVMAQTRWRDFDADLRGFQCKLFGASSSEAALLVEARLKEQQPQAGVCPNQWSGQDIAYRCLDCALDANCIQCSDCFFKACHEGHEVFVQRSGGGACDCGDPSSWNPAGFCPEHCATPARL
ncbi:unnamed protein product, partial [Effrenium voratum]